MLEFDAGAMERQSLLGRFINWLFSYPVSRWWLDPLRWLTPVMCMPKPRGGRLVLRYDEVREVLGHDRDFPVPWGWKMVEVTGGADKGGRNFVLGMAQDKEYRLSYQQLAEAFPLSDIKQHVASRAREAAEEVIAAVWRRDDPRFDAVEDLITGVPVRMCQTYYGIDLPEDPVQFGKWTLAVSSFLFGPPFEKQDVPDEGEKLARSGARLLRTTLRASIAAAKERRRLGAPRVGVVLPRLLEMQDRDSRVSDDVIHAQLFGMVLGFIPTDVLAGGNILETLLKQPEFLRRTRDAALAGDEDLLWRCLRETLRFRNINPGPLRVTGGAGYVLNRGERDEVRLKAGAPVLASTQAAMFDPRRIKHPHVFNPDRPDEDYLVFGVGQHWCLGAYIAIAQLVHTFLPLLREEGFARVEGSEGCMKRYTVFPLHLHLRLRKGKP